MTFQEKLAQAIATAERYLQDSFTADPLEYQDKDHFSMEECIDRKAYGISATITGLNKAKRCKSIRELWLLADSLNKYKRNYLGCYGEWACAAVKMIIYTIEGPREKGPPL